MTRAEQGREDQDGDGLEGRSRDGDSDRRAVELIQERMPERDVLDPILDEVLRNFPQEVVPLRHFPRRRNPLGQGVKELPRTLLRVQEDQVRFEVEGKFHDADP